MAATLKQLAKTIIRRLGYDVHRLSSAPPASGVETPQPVAQMIVHQHSFHDIQDVDGWMQNIANKVEPYTMTSRARVAAMCLAVEYVCKRNIAGDIVECGVWRGGSSMAAAWALAHLGDFSRSLHLFDTFEGMPPPGAFDRRHDGVAAEAILATEAENSDYWARASLEDVKSNMAITSYPPEKITYTKGRIENTIPSSLIRNIAVLRLDTDWYESTKHELEHLYPLLVEGGVLIVDDYGFWQGSRQAVDEYFQQRPPLLLSRVDETGRMAIKI